MLMCWAANPGKRPSFVGLSGIFDTILGNRSVREPFLLFLSKCYKCFIFRRVLEIVSHCTYSDRCTQSQTGSLLLSQ